MSELLFFTPFRDPIVLVTTQSDALYFSQQRRAFNSRNEIPPGR